MLSKDELKIIKFYNEENNTSTPFHNEIISKKLKNLYSQKNESILKNSDIIRKIYEIKTNRIIDKPKKEFIQNNSSKNTRKIIKLKGNNNSNNNHSIDTIKFNENFGTNKILDYKIKTNSLINNYYNHKKENEKNYIDKNKSLDLSQINSQVKNNPFVSEGQQTLVSIFDNNNTNKNANNSKIQKKIEIKNKKIKKEFMTKEIIQNEANNKQCIGGGNNYFYLYKLQRRNRQISQEPLNSIKNNKNNISNSLSHKKSKSNKNNKEKNELLNYLNKKYNHINDEKYNNDVVTNKSSIIIKKVEDVSKKNTIISKEEEYYDKPINISSYSNMQIIKTYKTRHSSSKLQKNRESLNEFKQKYDNIFSENYNNLQTITSNSNKKANNNSTILNNNSKENLLDKKADSFYDTLKDINDYIFIGNNGWNKSTKNKKNENIKKINLNKQGETVLLQKKFVSNFLNFNNNKLINAKNNSKDNKSDRGISTSFNSKIDNFYNYLPQSNLKTLPQNNFKTKEVNTLNLTKKNNNTNEINMILSTHKVNNMNLTLGFKSQFYQPKLLGKKWTKNLKEYKNKIIKYHIDNSRSHINARYRLNFNQNINKKQVFPFKEGNNNNKIINKSYNYEIKKDILKIKFKDLGKESNTKTLGDSISTKGFTNEGMEKKIINNYI